MAERNRNGNFGTPFCGALERSIKALDYSSKTIPTSKIGRISHASYEVAEMQHQRICRWLIAFFQLEREVEQLVDIRYRIYLMEDKQALRESRYPTARERIVNQYLMYIPAKSLAMIATVIRAFSESNEKSST